MFNAGYIFATTAAFILGFFWALRTKRSQKLTDYRNKLPVMDVRHFLNGPMKAFGTIEDFKGTILHHFTADITGVWQGNSGTLTEIFTYEDGKQEQRIWTLTVNSDATITGVAHDIVGVAHGKQLGNALNMHYKLARTINNKVMHFSMDDWLYQVNEHYCINKASMKKFGIVVARLTIGFHKEPHAA